MARTNKQGIAKKKAQQAKQKLLSGPKTRSNEGMKREYKNPLGSTYTRFMRSGKWVCDTTSCREDPDGFRLRRKPSGGEPTFVQIGRQSWAYRRYIRRAYRMSLR